MIYPDEPAFGSDSANGISVRAHFAALAMQGILTGDCGNGKYLAVYAVEVADALIAQLNMEPGAKS